MAERTAYLRGLARVAALALSFSLAGCSNLASFLADNLPEWAGGLPKDAPPRAGDPRYADYFKTQIAARHALEAQRLADREQQMRIERAQIATGQLAQTQSARSVMREAASAAPYAYAEDTATEADDFVLSGRTLY